MISEDFVSFETAKLLKEKGFNEKVICYYDDGGSLNLNKFVEFQCCNQGYGSNIFAAPTLQMAMKWLREVHNIMVSPYALSLGYYFEIFDLANRDLTGCKPLYKVGIPNKEAVSSTYEQACEEAIKYCLEKLI